MAKFIELHIRQYSNPIYINVDAILYFQEIRGILRIYTRNQMLSSSENSGKISRIEGALKYFDVIESYSKVKSMIED